jgi:hypothetical protein
MLCLLSCDIYGACGHLSQHLNTPVCALTSTHLPVCAHPPNPLAQALKEQKAAKDKEKEKAALLGAGASRQLQESGGGGRTDAAEARRRKVDAAARQQAKEEDDTPERQKSAAAVGDTAWVCLCQPCKGNA